MLFLIGLGLHEQMAVMKEGQGSSFPFLERTVGEGKLLSQLESLVHNPNVNQEPIKDLLAWVLRVSF